MASNTVPASTVGSHFVLKYYTMLNNSPSALFNFYKEESHFLHGVEGGRETEETGLENINERIKSLDFKDSEATLSVVDCQETINGGVLVSVVGHLLRGTSSRKFIQTFHLAQQSLPSVGYYIHNDIFRYLDETIQPEAKPEVEQSKPSTQPARSTPPVVTQPVAQPASHVEATQSAPSPSPSPAASAAPVASPKPAPTQATPPTQAKESTKPQKNQPRGNQGGNASPVTSNAHTNGSAEPKPEPKTAPAPNSWASKAQTAPKPQVQSDVVPQKPQPSPAPSAPTNAAPSKPSSSQSENRSIFVSNIPFSAKDDDIRAQFSSFGQILDVSVNKGTALVDFDSAAAARAAIDGPQITMDGRPLKVAEKRASRPAANRENRGENRENRGDKRETRGDNRGPRQERPARENR
eukprot:TRINITY_DN327_c0_g1_i1.p1 TRINITY_DN327_c0_g1~~TRINITY_DN327_c0_g1_i1.p1  ORF type:complete len:409 (-),score=109.80 TRINITY_DN327_c0_g1_i1:87-1313(-)